jgi:hypothetical protein
MMFLKNPMDRTIFGRKIIEERWQIASFQPLLSKTAIYLEIAVNKEWKFFLSLTSEIKTIDN